MPNRQHIINFHGDDIDNLNPDELDLGEIAIVHGETPEKTYIIVKTNQKDNNN